MEVIPEKETLLQEIYNDISSGIYTPSKPRGYISINKSNYITRLIPVFGLRDISVYYYCTKKLEKDIALNRIPNTYGGWSLGGEIRKDEEDEIKYLSGNMRQYLDPDGDIVGMDESEYPYPIESSFNPEAWKKNWTDFTGTLYTHSRADKYRYVAELDIANFYDNISLEILDRKLRSSSKEIGAIDLLIKFLNNWDRGANSPNGTPRGIPQDEVGDCSRIIANFYLQDFDSELFSLCRKYDAKYFRYADDQIIFAKSEEDLKEIVSKASIMILKHGLCFNHKKVAIMNKIYFETHFSFDWFMKRRDTKILKKEEAHEDLLFYQEKKKELRNNGISVLLRTLYLSPSGMEESDLDIFRTEIINESFLSSPKLGSWQLAKIHYLSDIKSKNKLISDLVGFSSKILHNRYHFVVLDFLKKIKVDTKVIESRIYDLSKILA